MAVDTGADTTTGWGHKPRTDPEEERSERVVESFVLNMNIYQSLATFPFKVCKLCKQEEHFNSIYMQNFLSCKDTKHLDFSGADRAHDVQHSVEGTAMADRRSAKVGADSPRLPLPVTKRFCNRKATLQERCAVLKKSSSKYFSSSQ